MQDRFEKEVQGKMEELKLTPSAPVWEKIEMKIRPERKKRRVVFWMLLAGFLLAGGIWWIAPFFNDRSNIAAEKKTPAASSLNVPGASKKGEPSKATAPTTTSEAVVTLTQENKKAFPYSSSANDRATSNRSITYPAKTNSIAAANKSITKESATLVLVPANKKTKEEVNNIARADELPATKIQALDTATNSKAVTPAVTVYDSAAMPLFKQENFYKDSSLKKKVAASKKWRKQVNISIGESNYASALLSKSGQQDASPLFSGINSPGTGGTNGINTNTSPAPTTGGLSFALGFSIFKKLNEHWELSLGLQYQQSTTKTKVGDKRQVNTSALFMSRNVAVDEIYTNTGTNDYTNRFHILETPVMILYRPAVKLPLYLSLGAAYGRLIATNALTYNSTTNIYYGNKENYNRNMLPLSTALQYRFGEKKKWQLQTGPVLQYNLLTLQKEGAYQSSHLSFAGLRTTIIF